MGVGAFNLPIYVGEGSSGHKLVFVHFEHLEARVSVIFGNLFSCSNQRFRVSKKLEETVFPLIKSTFCIIYAVLLL